MSRGSILLEISYLIGDSCAVIGKRTDKALEPRDSDNAPQRFLKRAMREASLNCQELSAQIPSPRTGKRGDGDHAVISRYLRERDPKDLPAYARIGIAAAIPGLNPALLLSKAPFMAARIHELSLSLEGLPEDLQEAMISGLETNIAALKRQFPPGPERPGPPAESSERTAMRQARGNAKLPRHRT